MARHRKPTTPATTARRVLLAAIGGSLALTGLAATPAAAHEGCVPDTGDEAGAMVLADALHSGARIYEDLSFAGAQWPAYASDNDRLADLFWATQPAGADWLVAQGDLEDWLDDQITC